MHCIVRQRHSRPQEHNEGNRCAILLCVGKKFVLLRMQYQASHDGRSNAGLCLAFPSLNGKLGHLVAGWKYVCCSAFSIF